MTVMVAPLAIDATTSLLETLTPHRRRGSLRAARRHRVDRRGHALDEAAAEHARLAVARIVEHAGLAGRDAFFAVDQLDLDPVAGHAEPSRLRRASRAHLDEDLAAHHRAFLRDLAVAEPVHVARADHDAVAFGVEPHDVERRAGRNAEAAALADGEMHDATMAAERAAGQIDDVARHSRARLEALDHVGVAAGRHEADVLAVVLVGDR